MNQHSGIKRVVIVGGGTAGWMAAAALAKQLGALIEITLIESKTIAPVGVGESTIPPLRAFHRVAGINEAEFMSATSATFKMGVSFEGWGTEESQYIHSFGNTGQESWMAGFQNLWLLAKQKGLADDFGDYCFELVAAKYNKFALSPNSPIHYAYHLDATKYALYLQSHAKKFHHFHHIEGTVTQVQQNDSYGYITSVTLADGQQIKGDLFIDCSGFQGLLIEQTLNTGYEDWGHWLPCDKAVVAQTNPTGPAVPYTRAIAHDCGWRWRIPLQNRIGNGLVYCSKYLTDEGAIELFKQSIDGPPTTEPRIISYRTGRRLKSWNKNCIALGLSSGFIEPLESTGIHLFMTGITRLLQLFPFDGFSPAVIKEYNKQSQMEFEKIRDFIVLHYYINQRSNSAFWRFCRDMDLPAGLLDKINLFKESARIFKEEHDPFRVESWAQVMLGQGITPESHHQVAQNIPDQELARYLASMKTDISKRVRSLPKHHEFINRYCKAVEVG